MIYCTLTAPKTANISILKIFYSIFDSYNNNNNNTTTTTTTTTNNNNNNYYYYYLMCIIVIIIIIIITLSSKAALDGQNHYRQYQGDFYFANQGCIYLLNKIHK